MKAIRLTNDIDLVLVNRTEDFEEGIIAYYIKGRVQYDTQYTQAKESLLKTYGITLSRSIEASAYDVIAGKSLDDFMVALKAQYDLYLASSPYIPQLRQLFEDIDGLVDSVVDI